MKLRIDGVDTEVPAVLADNGVAFYADHAGVVRSARAVYPPKSKDQMTPLELAEARIAELEAAQAPPPPPPVEE